MNPGTRTITRVNLVEAAEAERTFQILMGDDVAARRSFIEDNAHMVRLEDLDI
jgi:DNA gyrase subunit B